MLRDVSFLDIPDKPPCCVRLLLSLLPSYIYMSRVSMHLIIILHITHTLLIFRFASLHSLRWYLSLSTSIDNRLDPLYICITFIHTTALLIDLQSLHMSALCHVIPYLYYSALISLYLSLLSSVAFSILFLLLLISKCVYSSSYSIRIASLQGNHGYFLSM